LTRSDDQVEELARDMETRATTKYLRVSPQKARLVVDLIRGRRAGEAINILRFTKKRIAHEVEKTLRSAIANAEEKSEHLDVDELVISEAFVNEGPRMKRIRPAPMGRAYRYQRRLSHITIVVEAPER
jgi:large subunit ribosomal protein L22